MLRRNRRSEPRDPGPPPLRPSGTEPSVASAVATVTDATFEDLTEGAYTVVDFWAPWCAPCRTFAPVFGAVAREAPAGVRFGSCNVDDNPGTAQLLQIMSIPTLVVFGPDGSEVARVTGAVPRRTLEQLVDDLAARTG